MAWGCGGKPSHLTINNTGHTGDQSRVCPHSVAAIWPSGPARKKQVDGITGQNLGNLESLNSLLL